MKNGLYFLLFVILIFAACQEEYYRTIGDFEMGDTVKINMHHSLYNAEHEVYIFLDSVLSDSRCPEKVICIWSGNAAVRFLIHAHGQSFPFVLNTLGGINFPKEIEVEGFRVVLVLLTPYPAIPQIIHQNDYVAYVKVEKL